MPFDRIRRPPQRRGRRSETTESSPITKDIAVDARRLNTSRTCAEPLSSREAQPARGSIGASARCLRLAEVFGEERRRRQR